MRYFLFVTLCATLVGAAPHPLIAAESGYDGVVADPALVATVTARFEKDLRALGIAASVPSCRLMERVAVGMRDSDTAFGAACRVVIADKPSTEMLLCDDDFGESFAIVRSAFVDTPQGMAAFVRRACF